MSVAMISLTNTVGSDSENSESDEDGADDGTGFNMVMPATRAGRHRVLTSRMRDFLQSR